MVLFDTTFGKVHARVVLERPHQVYYGASVPITGRIHVKFEPRVHDIHELFGPINILIYLEGIAETSIHVSKDKSSHTYRGKAPLVSQVVSVYDGPIRLKVQEEQSFPFAISFPERVQRLPRDHFVPDEDPMFNMAPDQLLPPSLGSSWGPETSRTWTDGWIEYRLRSQVAMPHIDVRCTSYGEEHGGHLLRYEQPLVPVALVQHIPIATQRKSIRVSNEFLLPEHQRPVGFRARTKSFFYPNAYPTFAANVTLDGTAYLQLGQPMRFQVCIRPDQGQSTVAEVPQIDLKYCWVHINGFTQIRAKATFRSERYKERSTRLATFGGSIDQPWSKSNDYTRMVSTNALVSVASSFSTFNITRNYTIDLEMVVIVAQKEHKIKCKAIPVRIISPAIGLLEAGPADHAVLPDYEARGGASGKEAPPEYQPAAGEGAVVAAPEKHEKT